MTNVINLFADNKAKRSVNAVQHQRQTIQSFLEQLDNAQKYFMGLAQRHDAWVSELRGAARLAANAHAEDTQGRTHSFLRDLEIFEEELCEAGISGRSRAGECWVAGGAGLGGGAGSASRLQTAAGLGRHGRRALQGREWQLPHRIPLFRHRAAWLLQGPRNVAEGSWLVLGEEPTLDAAKESAEINASGRTPGFRRCAAERPCGPWCHS